VALTLAVIGIVYGAVMAYSQTDFKRLVAYTSVSHLGFVLLGIFSWNAGAPGRDYDDDLSRSEHRWLFVLVGGLQERIHTRDLESMGGLWTKVPRLSGAALFFSMASLGLPGIGDFVGEFLVLLGSYRISVPITVVASIGILRPHSMRCAWCSVPSRVPTHTLGASPI
jgi:NADH-quinone oxidoreductase subunit M